MTRNFQLLIGLSAFAVSGFFYSSVSWSEDEFADDAANIENVIVTATRYHSNLNTQSGNVSQIDNKALLEVAPVHINEIMQRSPGTWISRGNGQEHLTAIRSPVFTGTGACGEFLMAEDNIPLRAAGFCNANELFDANFEQAQRIEVLRGPANALFGSNAMHGVINVISADPADTLTADLGLEGGPHDYYRAKSALSNTQGKHAYLVEFNFAHDGGWRDDAYFNQRKFSTKYRYTGENVTVTNAFRVINLYQDTAGYIYNSEDPLDKYTYKDDDVRRKNFDPQAFRDVESFHVYSRIEYQANSDSTLVITPYARKNDMRFAQHWLPGIPIEENGHRSVGVQSALYHQDTEDYRWISGFDAEYTQGYLKQYQDQAFFGGKIAVGEQYDYDVDAAVAAWFAQSFWTVNSSTELSFGLRFEHTNYDYDNLLSDGSSCVPSVAITDCRYTRAADTTQSYSDWSPNIGIIYQLTDRQTLFANYKRGYRAPQTGELFRQQQGNDTNDLKTVEIESYEIGTRHQAENIHYELTAYYMEKHRDIFQNSDRQLLSGGETSHRGIELSLFTQLPANFDWTFNASIARHRYEENYQLADAIVDIKGNIMDTAPRRLASTQVGWQPLAALRAEMEWIYMDKYYLEPNDLYQYDGHTLLNFRVNYQLSPMWRVAARITNLSDQKYAERADFSTFQGYRYFPGEPRSVYIGVYARFD